MERKKLRIKPWIYFVLIGFLFKPVCADLNTKQQFVQCSYSYILIGAMRVNGLDKFRTYVG